MSSESLIPQERIQQYIYVLRGQRVILDRDLAVLYGTNTSQLKQAVRRRISRFPEDFMFELSEQEFSELKQLVYGKAWGGTRYPPMAFTEQGVAMLSSVINSDQASR